MTMADVLQYLQENGDTLPKKISQDLDERRCSTHEKITRLETKGLVQRRIDGDKSGVTEKGQDFDPDNFRGLTL